MYCVLQKHRGQRKSFVARIRMQKMTRVLYLLCLSSLKLLLIESTSEASTVPLSTVNESLLPKPNNSGKEVDELSMPANDNGFPKDAKSNSSQSHEIPVDNLLDMVQSELDKSEDIDKTQYVDFLTYLNEALKEDTQKVKVLFKNVWRTVDLGVLGSSNRKRSAATAQGMLQYLKDLWKWLCRHFFMLTNWFKPDGSEKEIDHLNKLGHDEKMNLLEKHSEEREEYYATNSGNSSGPKIDDSQVKKLK